MERPQILPDFSNYYSYDETGEGTQNPGSNWRINPEQLNQGIREPAPTIYCNAERERTRVKTLRGAFLELQRTLPAVPPDTKLSKLDVLVLATTYIAHLMKTLNNDNENQIFTKNGIFHPVKKWPMRSRLYAGILSSAHPTDWSHGRHRKVNKH